MNVKDIFNTQFHTLTQTSPITTQWILIILENMQKDEFSKILKKHYKDVEDSDFIGGVSLWMYISLICDIPNIYTFYRLKSNTIRKQVIFHKNIQKIEKRLDDINCILNNMNLSKQDRKLIDNHFSKIKNKLDSNADDLEFEFMDLRYNNLISQKITSKTGLRDLAMRYMVLILQITMKPIRKTVSARVIIELLESIISYDDLEDLTEDHIRKMTSFINTTDDSQNYSTAFNSMIVALSMHINLHMIGNQDQDMSNFDFLKSNLIYDKLNIDEINDIYDSVELSNVKNNQIIENMIDQSMAYFELMKFELPLELMDYPKIFKLCLDFITKENLTKKSSKNVQKTVENIVNFIKNQKS